MPAHVTPSYTIIALILATFVSIRLTGKIVPKQGEGTPVNRLLPIGIGLFLAGLVLYALSAAFDYVALYLYAQEMRVRLAPGIPAQMVAWQAARVLLITVSFALALALGWDYVTAEDMANHPVDKVAWFFLLLGIGRVAVEPILLIVQVVLQR